MSLYDHANVEWTYGPEIELRREYHASLTLSDGRVFVIRGSWAGGSNFLKDGEVYDPVARNWTLLPGVKVKPMLTHDRRDRGELIIMVGSLNGRSKASFKPVPASK